MSARFVQTRYTVPPGGFWFFELDGDRMETPYYDFAVRYTADILRRHGDTRDPATALAEHMCPLMPRWFCRGLPVASPVITPADAKAAAEPYYSKPLVPSDEITERMCRCTSCPRHRRDFCLHCSGLDQMIYDRFNGRRPAIPADNASGCCTCAGTFEAVIASVSYSGGDKIWEGAPDCCWRKDRR